MALVSTAAFATVSFNPADGTGFIGRGDVITYVGKSGLVVNPTILYTLDVNLSQDCYKIVGSDRHQTTVTQTFKHKLHVLDAVAYTTRQASGNGNISGYVLTGYSDGTPDSGADIPTDICASAVVDGEGGWLPDPNGANGGAVTVDSGSGVGDLTFNGVSIPYPY